MVLISLVRCRIFTSFNHVMKEPWRKQKYIHKYKYLYLLDIIHGLLLSFINISIRKGMYYIVHSALASEDLSLLITVNQYKFGLSVGI